MAFFHLTDLRKNNWSAHILIVVLVLLAYMLIGQIPLVVALVNKGLINAQSTTEMAEAIGYNTFLVYLLLPFVFTALALLVGVKFLLKRPVLSIFTVRKKLDIKRVLLSFFTWLCVLLLFLGITIYSTDNLEWNMNPQTFLPLLLISLLLIPLQTTCEELLFRGYLMQLFGAHFRKGWIAVLLSGILFGLLHGANPEVERIGTILLFYYIGTGVFLGVMTLMDDGLELSMGYHAANNIFACLIVTTDWQAFRTDALFLDHTPPGFGWDSILTLLVLQPMILLLFAKIYKWTGWKERLF